MKTRVQTTKTPRVLKTLLPKPMDVFSREEGDDRSWDSGELVATAMGLLRDLPAECHEGERWYEEVPQLRAVLAEDDGLWECHDGRAPQPCDGEW